MKIIEIALKEVGTKENPPESNNVKYNTWIYGKEVSDTKLSHFPWCAAFVSWCYDQSGLNLGRIDVLKGFVGCDYAVKNASKWGKIVTIPKEGDVCFFDWQGDGHFDHTGIFVKDLGGGLFQSIEGNTSGTNDSNGGEVMIRQRKYKNCIFIKPTVTFK
jgi:hypothetical protein